MSAAPCQILIYNSGNCVIGANIDLFMHFLRVIESEEQWRGQKNKKTPSDVWTEFNTHTHTVRKCSFDTQVKNGGPRLERPVQREAKGRGLQPDCSINVAISSLPWKDIFLAFRPDQGDSYTYLARTGMEACTVPAARRLFGFFCETAPGNKALKIN